MALSRAYRSRRAAASHAGRASGRAGPPRAAPRAEELLKLSVGSLSAPRPEVSRAFEDYYAFVRAGGRLPLGDPELVLPGEFAQLLGCSSNHLTFRGGTTACLEAALDVVRAHATRCVAGTGATAAVAVVTDLEHPVVLTAVRNAYARVEVVPLGRGACDLGQSEILAGFDHFLRSLKTCPEIVLFPHITWKTGVTLPYAELAALVREIEARRGWRRLAIVVDGAHSLGHAQIQTEVVENNAAPFDFFATCAHKWFGGPHGVGVLYAGPAILNCAACTSQLAWGDIFTCSSGLGAMARSAQYRTHDRAKAYALLASSRSFVAQLPSRVGPAMRWRFARAVELRDTLWKGLRSLPGVRLLAPAPANGSASGILTVFVEGLSVQDHQRLAERMAARGVLVDHICEGGGGIRFCIPADLRERDLTKVSDSFTAALRAATFIPDLPRSSP